MHETTPSDRVQLVGQSELVHPGCCALCGSGNSDDGYVNTGVYYDYEGQMYFCWICAHQIASVIGCLSAEETVHLQGLLSDAATELASVKAELEAANVLLGQYAGIFSILNSADPVIVDTGADPFENELQAVESESEVSGASAGQADTREPVTTESTSGSGRRKPSRTERSDSSTSGFTI